MNISIEACRVVTSVLTNLFFFYQDCVWYGVCNTNVFGHNQYCPYNGTAKPMPDDGIKLLQERCGFLLENGQKDFCCDAQQVA